MSDPVATIRGAYEKLGRGLDRAFADRIRAYLAQKPKGKHGQHRYEPEDWDFTKGEIRELTRAYVEAYGVALED